LSAMFGRRGGDGWSLPAGNPATRKCQRQAKQAELGCDSVTPGFSR
jgi:hypothetical protein